MTEAPRRPVKTFLDRQDRETYADTHRPVEERLGSHIVLWIVDGPELWAAKIEDEADALVAKYPKDRIAKLRRAQGYEDAMQVRASGVGRSWRSHRHSLQAAEAEVAELYRAHPNPGVRYEVAEITEASACVECCQPMIYADGQWRHHGGGYPAECSGPWLEPRPEEQPRQEGEFEIGTSGYMICGYCDETEHWPHVLLGHVTLTGFHLLGVERATGELVVLAEATTLTGQQTVLPHHCQKIPDAIRDHYAFDIQPEAPAAADPPRTAADLLARRRTP